MSHPSEIDRHAGSADGPRRFAAGVAAGKFPQPVTSDGVMVTGGSSRWLGVRCTTCNHTFRRGDRVWVADDGVQHLDPTLDCGRLPSPTVVSEPGVTAGPGGTGHDDVPGDPSSVTAFRDGLLDNWPTVNRAPVVRLSADDWQVTKRTSGPFSPVCPACGHTFRAGERVILCPCADRADDPRRLFCQLPVHRDPAVGLRCWDDWRPDGRLIRCPRTHEKLPG